MRFPTLTSSHLELLLRASSRAAHGVSNSGYRACKLVFGCSAFMLICEKKRTIQLIVLCLLQLPAKTRSRGGRPSPWMDVVPAQPVRAFSRSLVSRLLMSKRRRAEGPMDAPDSSLEFASSQDNFASLWAFSAGARATSVLLES